jgi:hypothetical protein
MLVVVPVSLHDALLIEDFCDAVNFFSPYRGHGLLVVGGAVASDHARYIDSRIGEIFDRSEVHIFNEDPPVGWPQGPNFYFEKTIHYLASTMNALPWFWMELDVTPVGDGWLDSLSREYAGCGAPCLGVLQDLNSRLPDNGRHLVGTAVYPPRLDAVCPKCAQAASLSHAFDYDCRDQLVPNSAQSRLIQHNFRTSRYYCSRDGIAGVEVSRRTDNVRFDNAVGREVLIVHGCNDGSLSRLITGRMRR